ncbi:MAG: hypothetical protein WCE94_06080 [Candidatus Methanoperedens sp.]
MKPQDYDMRDNDDDIKGYILIKDSLIFIHENLWGIYDRFDKEALRLQKSHRRLAFLATVCGTIAVLFAIVQLSGIAHTHWPAWVEILATVLAFLSVCSGLAWYRQKNWFLSRYKAESLRSLKFRSLVCPCLWCKPDDKLKEINDYWENQIRKITNEIKELTLESINKYAKKEEIIHYNDRICKVVNNIKTAPQKTVLKSEEEKFQDPLELFTCLFSENKIRTLVVYYRDKRLNVQIDYFNKQAELYEKLDKPIRDLPLIFFLGSVLAVFIHFIVDIFFTSTISLYFLFLAASLPVLSTGIRTYRSTHEFARSAALYRAKQTALERTKRRLKEEMRRENIDGKEILSLLWRCEDFLEAEHHEWLRLMLEAEWFT